MRLDRADLFYYTVLIAVLVAYIVVNRQADNSYPTPWPDEAHFLWQAHSVAEDNTLFSSELNTDRTIMWQPPGYAIFVGLLFKVFGSSLDVARMISLLLMIAAFLVLISLLTHYGNRWPILFISSLFFLNARFVACGNVARMEALLLLLVFTGFLLIQRGRSLSGLALLAISPIVHFNGFYFCLFGLGLVIFRGELFTFLRPFTREKITALVIVGTVWLAYVVLIAGNWESFILDMEFQLLRKARNTTWYLLFGNEALLLYLFILAGSIYAYKVKLRATELLFLATPALIIYPMGHELWYEVIDHLANLVVTVFFLHVWFHIIPIEGSILQRCKQFSLWVALMILLIGWNYRSDRIENMLDYKASFDFTTLGLKGGTAYLTDADQTVLSGILDSLASESGDLLVEFQPHADGFYFLDLAQKNVKFSCPVFQRRKPDLLVVHFSRHLPSWWRFGDNALTRMGKTRHSTQHILYQRDSTELWYFVMAPD